MRWDVEDRPELAKSRELRANLASERRISFLVNQGSALLTRYRTGGSIRSCQTTNLQGGRVGRRVPGLGINYKNVFIAAQQIAAENGTCSQAMVRKSGACLKSAGEIVR
jgi:hypothetical protein